LQTNEPAALAKFREEEAKTLQSYGWVDQQGGVARVPIAEAKKLIVQRGLPARTDGAAAPLAGTHVQATGESSGGRTLSVMPLPAPAATPGPAAPASPQPPAGGPAKDHAPVHK
jgi:hypothetical protein